MKKIMAGQGPTLLAGVKTEAGQFPSRVLIVTSRRGIGTFLQELIKDYGYDSYKNSYTVLGALNFHGGTKRW